MGKSAACFIVILFCAFFFHSCNRSHRNQGPQLPTVIVSIPPYKTLVKRLAGNTIRTVVFVPTGADAHTYEPTPRRVTDFSNARLWFRVGEPFESRASNAIRSHQNEFEDIDLRQGLTLKIHAHGTHCSHSHDGIDTHTWMSPRMMKKQASKITETLIEKFPKNKKIYTERLQNTLQELDLLDREIEKILKDTEQRAILVAHAAYGYFCVDYGLTQLTIECEGKEPTPQSLTRVLESSRKNNIRKIFTQPQQSDKAAKILAEELNAKIVQLDPYREDYFVNMRYIAQKIAE